MQTFKDHFSSKAAGYAAYRPTYPPELAAYLASISPATGLALDCGCGTGQLSVLVADCFRKVIATDASAQQIENATLHPRVEYRIARAEHSGLPANSIDLITVAQAAHWLDLEAFYAEARRIARPEAAVALITYGVLHVDGAETDAVVQHFYYDVIGGYWPPERRHVEEGYRSLPFPFREIQPPPLSMEASWTLDALLGYVHTWSAVGEAEKQQSSSPVETLQGELAKVWGDPETPRMIRWPLSLRVGHI